MKKKHDAPQARVPAGPLVIFDLRERVPGMSDMALENLLENAQRLAQSGNDTQRNSAEALMPIIAAELAVRAAKALADTIERKAMKKTAAAAAREARR